MTSGSTSRKAKAQAAAPRQGANKAVIAAVVAVLVVVAVVVAVALAPRQGTAHPARALDRLRPPGRRHRARGRHRGQPRQGQAGRSHAGPLRGLPVPHLRPAGEAVRRPDPLAGRGRRRQAGHPHDVLPGRQPAQRLLAAGRERRGLRSRPGRFGPYHERSTPVSPPRRARLHDAQLEGFAKTAGITGSALQHLAAVRQERAAHGVRQRGPDPEREGRRLRARPPSSSTARCWTCKAQPRVPHRKVKAATM